MSLSNHLVYDASATSYTAATATPSLTNLHIATSAIVLQNGDSEIPKANVNADALTSTDTNTNTNTNTNAGTDSLSAVSIQTVTPSLSSGLVYASDSSQLSDAKGSFAASSDVRTLSLDTTTTSGSSSETSGSSHSVSSTNGASGGRAFESGRKAKYGLMLSSIALISFVVSI
ncbi:hypothetical protein PP707_03425 [Acetobacter pasteurianus]|nr:hypothetical protein [Acetobacter pasteurianus]